MRGVTHLVAVVLLLLVPAAVLAETTVCEGLDVTVRDAGADAGLVCEAVSSARDDLASCGGLGWSTPVEIAMVPELPGHCVGLFDCGTGRIEILSPSGYAVPDLFHPENPFGRLSPETFLRSVIRHELVHVALQDMPCPFDACPVAQEFIAYALQIEFLPEEARAVFAGEGVAAPVPRDRLNAMMLMMAPHIFASNAWRYFRQQPDPCGFVGAVARGEVLLDGGPM